VYLSLKLVFESYLALCFMCSKLRVILLQFWVKKFFPWKFNLEYGGTFTKLFVHVSSRNMFPTIRNLQFFLGFFLKKKPPKLLLWIFCTRRKRLKINPPLFIWPSMWTRLEHSHCLETTYRKRKCQRVKESGLWRIQRERVRWDKII
jgi:hypothetical protein